MTTPPLPPLVWPLWQRVAFRFFATYFTLYIAPWTWLGLLPGNVGVVLTPWSALLRWAVEKSNAAIFHVRETLVMPNGSGDTSWSWAQACLYLTLAAAVTVVWSILDRRRTAYPRGAYWLRTIVRYSLAMVAIQYGVIKVIPLQMPFPALSQLSTPLGDLLPMRLSWLFIGYSEPYQMFCGAVELMAGVLLLWRRTVTLGVLLAVGAFANVLVVNLSYDVPVKLYALHLFAMAVFLLALDAPRLLRLFVLNAPVGGTTLYDPPAMGRRWRIAGYIVKAAAVILLLVMPFYSTYQRGQAQQTVRPASPLAVGVYDVRLFVRNGDTIPALTSDSIRWRDVVIDNPAGGSVGSTDPRFWQRYRRGYFRYRADTSAHTMAVWRTSFMGDSTHVFTARYTLPDSNSAKLWTTMGSDSLYVELVRSSRHFQLTERQFHWLSEYNR
ncbi:MAG: hypothetical protein V4617_06180 [Gemmatimonadota bacterium]